MTTHRLNRLTLLSISLLTATILLGACAGPLKPPSTQGLRSYPPAPAAAQVSVSDAASLRTAGAFMLDVREPDEWAAGHIPGATLIPLGQLPGRLAEVPRDRLIVTVCRSGNRSAQARDILLGAGIQGVSSMSGGMNEWIAAGFPVATGQ